MGLNRDLKCKSREDCTRRWITGRGETPTEEEIDAFRTGFNMAWKHKPHKVFVNRDELVDSLMKSKRLQ